jgi:hypothetical protein
MSRRIITEHICPPIPIRSCDWQAVFDNYEPGHPMGHGATKEAAVADLIEQQGNHDDSRLVAGAGTVGTAGVGP